MEVLNKLISSFDANNFQSHIHNLQPIYQKGNLMITC